MKTLLAALAAVGALTTVAGPAAAQPYGYDHQDRYDSGRYDDRGRYGDDRWSRGGYDTDRRQARLERRIDIAARRGLLTRSELGELRRAVWWVDRLEARYRADGRLSYRERAELDRHLDLLEMRIARRIGNRDYGYGYGERR